MNKNKLDIVYKKLFDSYNKKIEFKDFKKDIRSSFNMDKNSFNNFLSENFDANYNVEKIREMINLLNDFEKLDVTYLVDLTKESTETKNLKIAYKFNPLKIQIKKYMYDENHPPKEKIIYSEEDPKLINPEYLYESKNDILKFIRFDIDNILSNFNNSLKNNPNLNKKVNKTIINYKNNLSKQKISNIFSDFSFEDKLLQDLTVIINPNKKLKPKNNLKTKK
tara:strand:+ start:7657 stop:8322 length:666 start_codon:yes stop_codon:yes gene_type:complete